jgi:transcriptional regulator with XRE-family HTH domain
VVTVQGMFLRDLLPQHGIPSIAELRRRLGLRKQYAWLLWHGTIGLSSDMMRRLHDELGIPFEELMQVERATPAKRRGRKPTQPAPEAPRPDRFGWADGDLTIHEPEGDADA